MASPSIELKPVAVGTPPDVAPGDHVLFSLVKDQRATEWKVATILNRVNEDYANEYFIELVNHRFEHVFVQATTFRTYVVVDVVVDVTSSKRLLVTMFVNSKDQLAETKGTS